MRACCTSIVLQAWDQPLPLLSLTRRIPQHRSSLLRIPSIPLNHQCRLNNLHTLRVHIFIPIRAYKTVRLLLPKPRLTMPTGGTMEE
jgi:hypothetical protein